MSLRLLPRFVLISLLVYGASHIGLSQSPDSLWAKSFGGTDNDRGYAIVAAGDGGFAMVGDFGAYMAAGSLRNGDAWLLRTDEQGELLWSKTFGGPGIDEGNAIQQTSDGGFILAGAKSNNVSIYDAYLIRTDANGDTVWTRTYGERFGEEWANDGQETTDGGFIFTGATSSQTTFSKDIWLVRTDVNGQMVWKKEFGGTGTDLGNSVQQTPDGGFIIAGSTREIGNEFDLWLIRTDENGETLWTKRYNGQSGFNSVDHGRDIHMMPDGSFYVLAQAGTNGWLLNLDAEGDTLWTKQYPVIGNLFHSTSDGGFVMAGGTSLLRTDSAGATVWIKHLQGLIYGAVETPDGGFMAVGYHLNGASEDLLLYRLGSETATAAREEHPVPALFDLSGNYPNPFAHSTNILFSLAEAGEVELSIHNVLGQEVRRLVTGRLSVGSHHLTWDGRDEAGRLLGSGQYLYRLSVGNASTVRPLLLLR